MGPFRRRWIVIINSGIGLCPPWRNDVPLLLLIVEGGTINIHCREVMFDRGRYHRSIGVVNDWGRLKRITIVVIMKKRRTREDRGDGVVVEGRIVTITILATLVLTIIVVVSMLTTAQRNDEETRRRIGDVNQEIMSTIVILIPMITFLRI
jgi:hypothetical protein